ncbi:unnamed protein product [Acanthoscelides obtectus]|uniref:BRICHOS domain-containing protein n=1 Tax=Acanthoscelides obtectus TaxID=200917 RepID=A0A9P0NW40_ACAOB|nr:unnamed protein product [Acanthoscelides obtectus]CAK1655055.1 Neurofilament heavy polypeptide [Acanthoscelides obtectus]
MRSQVLMASSRTFFCECFVLLCVFSLPHIANLEESTRKAISSFQTTTGSTGKYTVLYDYENKIVVYKDLINQKCVLEVVQGDESFINTWIAQQSYGGNSQDLNTENDQLPKRELWYLAKHRIIDFCKGLPTFYLQKRANLNRPTYFTNEVEENIIGRWKRQTTHYFKGRVRGQTQSQYLNFGKSDGDGKAEAESTVEGSKAVVSGQNGIGQAQSQSIPFGCDECYEQEQTVELGRRGEKYPEPIVQRPVGPPVPGQGGRPGVYLRPGQVEGGQFPGQPWVPGGVSGVGGIPGQVRGVPGQEIPGQVPGRGPQQTWQPGQAWPPGPAPSAPSQERGQPPGQVAGPTGQLWPPGQVPSQPGGPDQTQLGRTSGQTWIPGQAPGQARGPTGQFWQPGQVPNQTGGPAPIEGGIPSGQAWAPGQVPSQTPGQTWIPGQVPGQIGGPSEQVWTPGQVGGPGQTQTGRAPGQTWVPGRGPGEFDIPGQAWLPGQIPGQIGVPGQVTGPSGQVWIPGQPPSQVPGQTWIPGQIPSAPGQITSVSGQPWTPGGQVAPPGQPGQIRVPGQVGGPSWTPAQVPGSIPSPGQVGIPGQPTWQGSGTQVLAGERDSGTKPLHQTIYLEQSFQKRMITPLLVGAGYVQGVGRG